MDRHTLPPRFLTAPMGEGGVKKKCRIKSHREVDMNDGLRHQGTKCGAVRDPFLSSDVDRKLVRKQTTKEKERITCDSNFPYI
jgi:hypothetical protein